MQTEKKRTVRSGSGVSKKPVRTNGTYNRRSVQSIRREQAGRLDATKRSTGTAPIKGTILPEDTLAKAIMGFGEKYAQQAATTLIKVLDKQKVRYPDCFDESTNLVTLLTHLIAMINERIDPEATLRGYFGKGKVPEFYLVLMKWYTDRDAHQAINLKYIINHPDEKIRKFLYTCAAYLVNKVGMSTWQDGTYFCLDMIIDCLECTLTDTEDPDIINQMDKQIKDYQDGEAACALIALRNVKSHKALKIVTEFRTHEPLLLEAKRAMIQIINSKLNLNEFLMDELNDDDCRPMTCVDRNQLFWDENDHISSEVINMINCHAQEGGSRPPSISHTLYRGGKTNWYMKFPINLSELVDTVVDNITEYQYLNLKQLNNE